MDRSIGVNLMLRKKIQAGVPIPSAQFKWFHLDLAYITDNTQRFAMTRQREMSFISTTAVPRLVPRQELDLQYSQTS